MSDFVIVGGGSAGCVLANRLSADPQTTVLLLEAGGPDTAREIHIPVAFSKLFKTACDWAYHTEPQPHLNNRRLFWPRGKVLGGSSSINAMIYIRGNRADFDRWAELGNTGWSFDEVLPYFKKSENQERGQSEYHGIGGPLNVADLREVSPLSNAFVEAASLIGHERNEDFNSPKQEGFGIYQVTQKMGRRHSAAGAFLKPALTRPNLTVYTRAHVTRILIEKNRARGVAFFKDGTQQEVRANREVILAGGSVNSPQLLMLSGIGPAENLRRAGIDVFLDLPGVGQNLQDHPVATLAYECKKPITLANAKRFGNVMKYALLKRGPLTSNVAEAGGFVKTAPELPAPDLQYLFAPAYFLDHGATQPAGHGFSIGPTLIAPSSRGTIALRSNDPFEAPAIQPNYLSDAREMQVLAEGFRETREMILTSAFDPYRGNEVFPGAVVRTDSQIRKYLRNITESLYHAVGTCKMGTDATSVVDPQLRVNGVDCLRVADASIMPAIVSGNTNAATMMIAEKAAELIRFAPGS